VTTLRLSDPGPDAVIDPICQLPIARQHAVRGDDDRWFCSEACADIGVATSGDGADAALRDRGLER